MLFLLPSTFEASERPKSLTRIKGAGALKLKNFMLRTGAIGSTAA